MQMPPENPVREEPNDDLLVSFTRWRPNIYILTSKLADGNIWTRKTGKTVLIRRCDTGY